MSESHEASPQQRLAGLASTLRPTERKVAEMIGVAPEVIVESTAQELAERVGVARTSVIRTVQALGYDGYAQFRVAVARHLTRARVEADTADAGSGDLGALRAEVARIAQALPGSLALLSEESVARAVDLLVSAGRVQCIANGVSGPIAADLAMRLTSAGRIAEHVADALSQQIAATQLGPRDVALVVSGSGSNELTLRAVRAAREAGATVVAVTSFATSPLAPLADLPLVVPSVQGSFRDELEVTSRVPHSVFLGALTSRVVARLGEQGSAARSRALSVVADNLSDDRE